MAFLFLLYNIINKNILTNLNYVDWLRNLQIKFVPEKNSNILDIFDPRSISNNKKTKDVYLDIIYLFCDKFRY